MKRKIVKQGLLIAVLLCILLFGCKQKAELETEETENGTTPAASEQTIGKDPVVRRTEDVLKEIEKMANEYGYQNALSELTEMNISTIRGDTYYRLQQNFRGIPVYGRSIIYVTDEYGEPIAITENVADLDETVPTEPTVTCEAIENGIRCFFREEMDRDTLSGFSCSDINPSALVMYYDEQTFATHLAYMLQFCADGTVYNGIVDAHTGEMLQFNGEWLSGDQVVAYMASDTERENGFYVEQDEKGSHILMDGKRGIVVRNLNGNRCDDSGKLCLMDDLMADSLDVVSENEVFGDSQYERYAKYEFAAEYLNTVRSVFDWFGEEYAFAVKSGRMLLLYNDMWNNGNNNGAAHSWYRDNTSVRIPIITVGMNIETVELEDMVHEFTHVVSEQTIVWNGGNMETKAIDEALSDIFSVLVCHSMKNGNMPDWTLNGRDKINPGKHKVRASNGSTKFCKYEFLIGEACPVYEEKKVHTDCLEEVYYPNYYKGENWYPNVDAHVNSLIISRAAYLMWNGIDGNESKKIEIEELGELWYRTMLMMPSDCDFYECRKLVYLAAESMGLSDQKQKCVLEAFDHVGVTKDVSIDHKISTETTLEVFDKNGGSYGNYTYYISGKITAGSNFGKKFEKTVAVDTPGQQLLELETGTYTIRIVDNEGAQQPITIKVAVSKADDSEAELLIYTNYGFDKLAVETLEYKMITQEYPHGKKTGVIVYPYFLGSSRAEEEMNKRYSTFLEVMDSGDVLYIPDPRSPLIGFDKINAEVTYNQNGVVSIKETCVADYGGAHPYTSVYGLIYENSSGRLLTYNDVISGTDADKDRVLQEALQKAEVHIGPDSLRILKENTGHTLTEKGLCFYFNVGDAVERREIILPFTSQNSYTIEAGNDVELQQQGETDLRTGYSNVLNEVVNKGPDSSWPEDCGMLYDLNADGVEELIILHHATVDFYGTGGIPCTVCSVYTISGNEVVALMEKKALFTDGGGPKGGLYIAERNGVNLLVLNGENGGGGGDDWYGDGIWEEYSFNGKELVPETIATYQNHETWRYDGVWVTVPADCSATMNGQETTYGNFSDWRKELSITFAIWTTEPKVESVGSPVAELVSRFHGVR